MEDNNSKEVDNLKSDAETVKLINKHFEEASNYRKSFEPEWEECEDFYANKHWKDSNKTFKNLIFPLIEQEMSILTDSMPGTDVLASRPEKDEAAKVLENAIHYVYEQQNLQLKQVMTIRSMLKTGNGFQYVDFDPNGENGEGTVLIKNIPWRHVFLDPAASDIDEAAFVGIKFPVRTAELKRRFPNFKDKITPNNSEQESSGQDNKGREDRDSLGRTYSGDMDRYKINDMAILEEAWLRDYTMTDIPEEDTIAEIEKETNEFFQGINPDIGRYEHHENHMAAHGAQKASIVAEALGLLPQDVTEQDIENLKANDPEIGMVLMLIDDHNRIHAQYQEINPDNQKPKFNSSLRLVMKTGGTILYDGSAPVDDGMVPLVPYYAYKEEDSIWAFGEIKNILSSQKSYNEMDNAEYESLHLTSNGGYIIGSDCGVKPSEISNKRGKVYVTNPGSRFERNEPGQTSPQLSMRKQNDQMAMNDITGVNAASQGQQPGGVTAAKAIAALQQTTNGRVRLKATQIALYSMPRLGKLTASRIVKYWPAEKMMRITDSTTGEIKEVIFNPEEIKDLDYSIRVVPGTLAGTDKEAIFGVLEAFVEKGMITPKTFITIAPGIPYKKKILEEMEANDQQAAMLQQLAAENEQMKAQLGIIPADTSQEVAPQDAMVTQAPEMGQ